MTRSMDLTQYTGMVGVIAGLYALILGIYGLLAGAELKRDRSMRLLAGGLGLLLTGVYRLGDVSGLELVGLLLMVGAILYPQGRVSIDGDPKR